MWRPDPRHVGAAALAVLPSLNYRYTRGGLTNGKSPRKHEREFRGICGEAKDEVIMRVRFAALSARSDRPAGMFVVMAALAALGVGGSVAEAQRETAPAGVTNYTRVDA